MGEMKTGMMFAGWVKPATVLLALFLLPGCGGTSGGGTTPPPPTVPSAPIGVTAPPGNAQVSLSWNASSGATSYHVKRATVTGGPYTQVAAPSATNDTDTGLTNGTAYFYVISALNSAGESGNSAEVSATPVLPVPATPTGLTATAGNAQVSLSWIASSGAATYNVKRGTVTGGPYTTVASPTATNDADTGRTNGTTYFYVVSAVNAAGESANSTQVSATPTSTTTTVSVTVDVRSNRHAISQYVYGGSYPKDAAHITDSGMSVVRWGGNGTSTYNWKLHTNNADNDYYFEDFGAGGLGDGTDGDSAQFIQDVKTAGSSPIMTMVMLPWVAKSAETSTTQGVSNNYHWSYSVMKYGAQCKVDPFNVDAGNGIASDCSTQLAADPNDAYVPLLDQPGTGDPAGSLYRSQWAAALATAFGAAPHFYNMDNEIDIWGGTHIDIHPLQSGYNELRDTYISEARALKGWDPQALRLGPVSCCWYFYWNLNSATDNKSTHAGMDFLPWWLNDVAWSDAVEGSRSLDIFDIHAYPDADTPSTQAQKQALAASIYRDWWDPTFPSAAHYIVQGGFSIEPVDSIPFRIPRMRAILNSTYPGTQFSVTEWSAAFARESDFSTALGDADAYGILGRERAYLASRWTAPDPANPNYQILKLYRNFDGAHGSFAPISVSATNNGNPNLFSSFAAVNSAGTTLTMMVVNKDPANTAQAQFTLTGFTGTQVKTYTVSNASPTTITASSSHAWSSSQSFAPYSVTLLVVTGTSATNPATEWDPNPDTIMVSAGNTVTLSPKIVSGSGTVTLSAPQFDSGITVTLTDPNLTTAQNGTITVVAGSTPGFYHYSVTGVDNAGVSQTQGGWIVVGKPPVSLSKMGDNGSGAPGSTLNLSVTMAVGSSGATKQGASILFTTDAGTLSNRIVTTNASGAASVVLTLPSTSGMVHVTAEAPVPLGGTTATFTETSQ
jgi:fibronectin type 3 domain-containing protein